MDTTAVAPDRDENKRPRKLGRRAQALGQHMQKPLGLLWRYVRARPYGHALLLLAIAAAVGCSLASQFATRNLIDALPTGRAHPDRVVRAFLIIVALLFADNLFWRLAGLAGVRTFVAVTGDVRRELFGYLTGHSPGWFAQMQPGTLASRITATANAIFTIENTSAWSAIPTFLSVLGAVVLIGWVSIGMTFAFVGISVGMTLFLYWLAKKGRERHVQFASRAASVDGEMVDLVSHMSTIKAFGATARECTRFGDIVENEVKSRESSLRQLEKLRLVHATITVALSCLMLGWVVWLWTQNRATTGDVVLVSSLGFAILHGTRDLALALVDMTQHVARLAEAAQSLLVPREMEQRTGLPELQIRDANIDFENISFAYPGRRPVLEHFSLHIDAGQRVGLVGPSGAGKSTVFGLLLRWFDPPQGQGAVCISGQRLCDVSRKSLHDAVSIVPQDVSLFNRSLLENLRYGRPEATEEEVLQACEQAGCLDLIRSLPDGLHTVVGEHGARLSGGQRQRIAIARAFLKNAPILLLDEATSALDSASEAIIQAALEKLMKGRTVVAIAHRLSTLQNFDRIVVIQRGRIVGDGPPQELARRPGIYRDVLLRYERRAAAAGHE